MKKWMIITLFLLTAGQVCAQHKPDKAILKLDSMIKAAIIDTTLNSAYLKGIVPDWDALHEKLSRRYSYVTADRNVTMAQINYYYNNKNWPALCTGLVHYTNTYEDMDNLPVINNNARLLLQYSTFKKDWKAALGWSKHTLDKDASNVGYKKTFDDLTAKLSSH